MIKRHLNSYRYAIKGIWLAFRHEPNMAIHFVAAIAVVVLNYVLDLSQTDWLITIILIGVVWTAEIFNTAIEKLADRVTKEHDELIGKVKDLSAGAVLIICIAAVVCGVIIYWPYVGELGN